MEYNLLYHPDIFKEDLPQIPAKFRDTIKKAIEERLLIDPLMFGKPLRKSLKGHRKLRVSDYRIIYRIQGRDIIILKLGHRKEVYSKIAKRINK